MADELYSVLNRFHREVMIPDMQLMVGNLRDEMLSLVLPAFHREVVVPDILRMLAQFHREVVLPDIQRIVGDAVAPLALRDEMRTYRVSSPKR